MRILITNDDGWGAKGIVTLVDLMRKIGDVWVVAPDGPRSGQSSAVSFSKPLRIKQIESQVYVCNGTPVDCMKVALEVLLKDKRPDLVVSGINHGSNAAVNVLYSGTMGAVFVAAENNIPAIGFSITDHSPNADFSYFEPYILRLVKDLYARQWSAGLCYNVNAPIGEIKGIMFTRQCKGYWHKEMQEYTDPIGEKFYMLTGEFNNTEPGAVDTDEWALANGYVSVTPENVDMTDYCAWKDLINTGLES